MTRVRTRFPDFSVHTENVWIVLKLTGRINAIGIRFPKGGSGALLGIVSCSTTHTVAASSLGVLLASSRMWPSLSFGPTSTVTGASVPDTAFFDILQLDNATPTVKQGDQHSPHDWF